MPNPITQPQAWWNAGRNPALKNAPWGDIRQIFGKNINPNTLLGDDFLQRGYGKGGPGSGWDWSRGFRPWVSAEEGGPGSGPTEAGRRALTDSYRFLKNFASPIGLALSLGGSTPQDKRWMHLGYESEDDYNNKMAERAAIEGEYVEPEPLLNQVFDKLLNSRNSIQGGS